MAQEKNGLSLKVVTLNVNRGFSPGGMDRVYEFLKGLNPDIACLQDVRETHSEMLADMFPGGDCFVPTAIHPIPPMSVAVGIGIYARDLPFLSCSAYAYAGQVSPIRDLDGVEVDERGTAYPEVLARFRETQNSVVLFVEVEVGDKRLSIGTTHGVWTPKGTVDDYQYRSILQLGITLASYGERHRVVVAGDWNAPRGDEMHKHLLRISNLTDCTPPEIINTVDWKMRGRNGPDVAVDYILAHRCEVSQVRTHFGVSDHAAVSAVVSLK